MRVQEASKTWRVKMDVPKQGMQTEQYLRGTWDGLVVRQEEKGSLLWGYHQCEKTQVQEQESQTSEYLSANALRVLRSHSLLPSQGYLNQTRGAAAPPAEFCPWATNVLRMTRSILRQERKLHCT